MRRVKAERAPKQNGSHNEHLCLRAPLVLRPLENVVLRFFERGLGLLLLAHYSLRATLDSMAPLEESRVEGEEPDVASALDAVGPHGFSPLTVSLKPR